MRLLALAVCLFALGGCGSKSSAPHPTMALQSQYPQSTWVSGATDNTGTPVFTQATPGVVDTSAGDLASTVVHFIGATSAGSLPDAGTFIAANVCNEGTTTGWFQVYFGQTAIDAGGTAGNGPDSGLVPSILPLRIPSGACASLNEPQTITGGAAVWYSSSTQGILTIDAGVPNMAADIVRR